MSSADHYVLSCPCGAPARFQPPPFESDRRCRACLWRDLVARLPRAARWSWETYPRVEHLRGPYEAAQEWFADYGNGAEPGNLFIYGPPGVGKSGLVWCIARSEVEA